jgi:hypothetical protein
MKTCGDGTDTLHGTLLHASNRPTATAAADRMCCVQHSFINMQIFLSSLRATLSNDVEVSVTGALESRLRQSVDALISTFSELQEVLARPMMQYAVLQAFLVRALGRKSLATRISSSEAALIDVRPSGLHPLLCI